MEPQDITSRRGVFTVVVGVIAVSALYVGFAWAVPAVDGGRMADGPVGPLLLSALLVQVAIIIFLCRYILDEMRPPKWLLVLALGMSAILAAVTGAVT